MRHYLEMVVAMVVGMVALHPLWTVSLAALGRPDVLLGATAMALVMATNMSIGMGAWMRYRDHSWRSILEMSAVMYMPFVVLLPLVWAGTMSGSAMIAAGHVLMLPAMLALMLRRRRDHGRRRRSHSPVQPTPVSATHMPHAARQS